MHRALSYQLAALRSADAAALVSTQSLALHAVVIWTTAALRWDPSDDLVRIGNVTGFAVYAVRWIQTDAFAIGLRWVVDHLIYICRTKILTRTAEFFYA